MKKANLFLLLICGCVLTLSSCAKISKKDAERIRKILYDDIYCIPEHLQKSIEFDLKFVVR